MYGKGFLGNMTENLHADCVQSRQAGFMQCFLSDERGKITQKTRVRFRVSTPWEITQQ